MTQPDFSSKKLQLIGIRGWVERTTLCINQKFILILKLRSQFYKPTTCKTLSLNLTRPTLGIVHYKFIAYTATVRMMLPFSPGNMILIFKN